MNQEERNKRKQKWMAHGYSISAIFRQSATNITTSLDSVRDGNVSDFDSYTEILSYIETILNDCRIADFTEKYMLFKLADVELQSGVDSGR
jgi:hypothetical protein